MLKKKMRLDKYLGHIGYGSRSNIQKMIKQRRVIVDNTVATKVDLQIVPEEAVVLVDQEQACYKEHYHFILHKPMGVITATEDPRHETVLDLFDEYDRNKGVAPVGRLDKDTEGLLILTTDGKLAHSLLSPKKHVSKIYYAKVEGHVVPEDKIKFEEGIVFGDGTECMPAKLEILKSDDVSEVLITLEEGKFHQVKRMMQNVGKNVIYLKRIQMGDLTLPEDLGVGEYRELTTEELELLQGRGCNE
ncbi:MAG: pseudouridine synthase [Cellulosilyticaceae bacterium]